MNPVISVSAETLNRLKACAEPFVDRDPEDVIRRLLEEHDSSRQQPASLRSSLPRSRNAHLSRVPRERGTTVEINNRPIHAVSVRDLYEQVLKLIVDEHRAELTRLQLLPFRTSRERYLLADKPIHPSGNPFVVTVKYHGYFMEAHKDYKNALAHLRSFLEKLGLQLKYLG